MHFRVCKVFKLLWLACVLLPAAAQISSIITNLSNFGCLDIERIIEVQGSAKTVDVDGSGALLGATVGDITIANGLIPSESFPIQVNEALRITDLRIDGRCLIVMDQMPNPSAPFCKFEIQLGLLMTTSSNDMAMEGKVFAVGTGPAKRAITGGTSSFVASFGQLETGGSFRVLSSGTSGDDLSIAFDISRVVLCLSETTMMDTPPPQGLSPMSPPTPQPTLIANPPTLPSTGNVIDIFPGQVNALHIAIDRLQNGDTLIVHEGTYQVRSKLVIFNKQGITIRAALGERRPLIQRTSTASIQNAFNIEGNSEDIQIEGLELRGNGADGVRINTSAGKNIVLSNLVIRGIQTGINVVSGVTGLTIQGCDISDTKKNGNTGAELPTGDGTAIYLGCPTCSVVDATISRNYIHDLNGSVGRGIEVQSGCFNTQIIDNVFARTTWSAIRDLGTRSLIVGNAIKDAAEAGIEVFRNAVIFNNLVVNSKFGIKSVTLDGIGSPGNISFAYNTFSDVERCWNVIGWDSPFAPIVFENNVLFCKENNIDAFALSGTFINNNLLFPARGVLPPGFSIGDGPDIDFRDAAGGDYYPAGGLLSTSASTFLDAASFDFDNKRRTSSNAVIGAYTIGPPGRALWELQDGKKVVF